MSAAEVYRDRVVAIVLTGGAGDGAEGARAVGLAGGIVIAQNEAGLLDATGDHRDRTCRHGVAIEDIGPALLRLRETGSLA